MIPPEVQSWIRTQIDTLHYKFPDIVFAEVVSVLNEFSHLRPKTAVCSGRLLLFVFSANTDIAVPIEYPEIGSFRVGVGGAFGSIRDVVLKTQPPTPTSPSHNTVVLGASPLQAPPPPPPPPLPAKPNGFSQVPQKPPKILPSLTAKPPAPPPKPPQVSVYENVSPNPSASNLHHVPSPVSPKRETASAPAPAQVNKRTTDSAQNLAPAVVDLMNNSVEFTATPVTDLLAKLQAIKLDFGSVDAEAAELRDIRAKLDKYEAELILSKRTHMANIRAIKECTKRAKKLISEIPQDIDLDGIEGLQKLVTIENLPRETAIASDMAIQSVLAFLPRALDAGSLSFELYLRLVRQYAREQFIHRSARIPPKPPKA